MAYYVCRVCVNAWVDLNLFLKFIQFCQHIQQKYYSNLEENDNN